MKKTLSVMFIIFAVLVLGNIVLYMILFCPDLTNAEISVAVYDETAPGYYREIAINDEAREQLKEMIASLRISMNIFNSRTSERDGTGPDPRISIVIDHGSGRQFIGVTDDSIIINSSRHDLYLTGESSKAKALTEFIGQPENNIQEGR